MPSVGQVRRFVEVVSAETSRAFPARAYSPLEGFLFVSPSTLAFRDSAVARHRMPNPPCASDRTCRPESHPI